MRANSSRCKLSLSEQYFTAQNSCSFLGYNKKCTHANAHIKILYSVVLAFQIQPLI